MRKKTNCFILASAPEGIGSGECQALSISLDPGQCLTLSQSLMEFQKPKGERRFRACIDDCCKEICRKRDGPKLREEGLFSLGEKDNACMRSVTHPCHLFLPAFGCHCLCLTLSFLCYVPCCMFMNYWENHFKRERKGNSSFAAGRRGGWQELRNTRSSAVGTSRLTGKDSNSNPKSTK